ncbi:reverse transcriptase [Lasius niger]|uniref:Reverse transcriptase n=1 Tax=Lasius niger TaxID=67767 RepID=A0A0J7KFA7_LASNI|nr:reverse transcriptase [Lasius niger]
MEAVPQLHQEAVVVSTPVTGSKRKARKVSPDAPSEDEPGTSGTQRAPRVVLRKLRTRKRKPLEVNDRVEEISSASMSADSDWVLEREEGVNEDSDLEITGTQQLDVGSARKLRPKNKAPVRRSSSKSSSTRKDSDLEIAPKTNTSQGSNKGKRKSRVRRKSLTSSEDEDEDSNFAPEELRAMGATAAGSLGLECINDVESERKNSPNINGQISGRMKTKLKRAKKIINTLVYKAEASGDPALLRLKNRELTDEVQSLKLNEVVIKRELEDMRSLVDSLRREISDLKDRVEEAEEDRRKSRESQRIMLWRHKKERGETVCESPSLLMDDPPAKIVLDKSKVDTPLESSMNRIVEESKPPSSQSILPSVKDKNVEGRTKEINSQIRNLIRQRAELKRQPTEDSGTGSDKQRANPRPLPQKILSQRTSKTKVRVVSNVQLAPPRSANKDKGQGDGNTPRKFNTQEWTEVCKKRGEDRIRRDQRGQDRDLTRNNAGASKESIPKTRKNMSRKPPKTSAVMITGHKEEFSYAEALKKARESISLKDLEIDRTKVRRAANGGMIIEVIGPDSARKAVALKNRLCDVLQDEAQVTRPVVRGEIRLIGLDASTSTTEVKDVVVNHGGCLEEDVKVGAIRPMTNGLFTVWVQCPLNAAMKIAGRGKVSIGWTSARVDLLGARPTQCFKCWQFGHLRHTCQSKDNFSGLCFRCGGSGHAARNCNAPPSCKLCTIAGRASNHRLGSNFCPAVRAPANVNRSRPSLDLLIQHAKETDVGVLLVSEPYSVPGSDNWFASGDGLASIYCDANFTRRRCLLVKQGRNFVAVGCGDYLFISVYVSPRLGLRDFNSILDEISLVLSNRVDRLVIEGDFNAKACLWGASRTNGRGRLMSIWAAERDLRLANIGNNPTCVRAQGSSIVDITWVSSDILPFVKDWRVEEEIESLSDHLFIAFALSTSRSRPPPGRPSNRPRKPRRQTYWWQDSVASLRSSCIRSRRRWQRAKRRRQRDQQEIEDLGVTYKLKRKELRTEIAKLKSQAWQELIDSIDNDPWGLPYRLVIKKLKAASPSLTELLDPVVLSDLLDSLFARNDRPDPQTNWEDFEWSDDWNVQLNEISNVISKKTASASKAPGPDGFGLIIWKRTPGKILEWIRLIFDECLKKGVFPTAWKRANLVLIPKASKPGASESRLPKVRPICLLDNIGKAFERVIVNRILLWQGMNPESENQFGFVKWRSTCDALLKVKEIALLAVKTNGGFAFAISLDIRNAFNSVPWRTIRGALRHKEFPAYIRRILDSYLCSRSICFVGRAVNVMRGPRWRGCLRAPCLVHFYGTSLLMVF